MLPENVLNGGLPEPPANLPVRVITARHEACGATTRVRLPSTLSPRALRRFRCARCAVAFETRRIEEVELRDWIAAVEPEFAELEATTPARAPRLKRTAPRLKRPAIELKRPALNLSTLKKSPLKLPRLNPQSRTWKVLSVPIAGALVIVVLLALRGGDEQPAPTGAGASAVGSAVAGGADRDRDRGARSQEAEPEFVRASTYSLALPEGWQRIDPPAGATFAAAAPGGDADATLWVTRDPKLDFPTFVSQSLAQLETLAGSAQIVERVPAPTPEGTIVRLAADAPAGQPTYEATLRVSGPYRYYLATSVQSDAAPEAVEAADLIVGTFTPELEG